MGKMAISVGELRRVITEGESEFKPLVFGVEVSKKENEKAYADIKKETEKYDGGLTKKNVADTRKDNAQSKNDNLGMHDLRFDSINKPFMDRVKSQMKGYVSKQAEDAHKDDEFGNATFDKEGEFYDKAKKHAEESKEGHDKASEIGLTGRELNKKDIEDQDKNMYENKNKIKMLSFKNTKFISEGHMMTMIPDEYKVEGKKFIMRDGSDNQYLVEWKEEPKVTKKLNMTLVNEQKERMKKLWGYKSPEAKTSTSNFRIQEDNEFADMVKKARKLND